MREGAVNTDLEKVIVKSVAGFLNGKDGGILVIGIDPNGTALGLEDDYRSSCHIADRDGFERHLRQLVSKALGESMHTFITITFHDIESKDVCQVRVEPCDRPVYVSENGKPTFFLRTGNATNALPVDEVVKYYVTRWR